MSETTADDSFDRALRREDREQQRSERENFESHEHRHSDDTVDVSEVAQAWLLDDPDPQTREELNALLVAGDARGLAQRFQGRLQVSSRGLVGTHGAGPAHLNRVTVSKFAAALAGFLRARGHTKLLLVRDDDPLSRRLVDDIAEILLGAGLKVGYRAGSAGEALDLGPAMAATGAETAILVSGNAQSTTIAVHLEGGSTLRDDEAAELDAAMATTGPLMTMARGSLDQLQLV